MLEKYIKLNSIDEIKDFAAVSSTKDFDITVGDGKETVNAKVIEEIFALDLTKTLLLRADTKSQGELLHQLRPFLKRITEDLKD